MNSNSTAKHTKLERSLILSAPLTNKRPALFLDRDGVLIEDKHYLIDPNQVVLCQGAKTLVEQARQYKYPVVLITNQSGIARGYFNWESYERVTDRILELLGPNAPIAAIYSNGHGPDASKNSWRKPSPSMLIEATKDLNLALKRSLLIGDRLSDLQAGADAGLAIVAHVLNGHGQSERPSVQGYFDRREYLADNNKTQLLLLDSLMQFPMHLLDIKSEPSI